KPVSRNARCGNGFGGQTCLGSRYGNCCSQYSYCGTGRDYCKAGCQSPFGICD
ncbi:carbohydrate-binding module family 18 protein, partial [Sporormia fimetaria CBS 119925]